MTNTPSTPIPDPHTSTEWWNAPWFRRHAIVAPFGALATTWLLCWRTTGQWECWQHLEMASSLADLAAIIYGTIAVTFEGGVKLVFWAIEQWKNQRARDRAEGLAEGLAEGRAAGRAAGLAEGRAEAAQKIKEAIRLNMTVEDIDALLEQMRRENGVNGTTK